MVMTESYESSLRLELKECRAKNERLIALIREYCLRPGAYLTSKALYEEATKLEYGGDKRLDALPGLRSDNQGS